MDLSLLLYLVLSICVTFLYQAFKRKPQTFAVPPGPPPKFLIGNLRQIPKTYAWKTYVEWAKTYDSDVISFTGFRKRIIVLNSARATTDLLEKRGAIYSDRDHNVMLQDLMGFESMALMKYTDKFRLYRKVMNTALNPTVVRDYYSIQEKEAYALLDRMLESPDRWEYHIQRAANSTVLTVTYGHEVTSDDDYLVDLSESTVKMIRQALLPTSFLVNMVPFLKHTPDWVPGLYFKRFVQHGRALRTELRERPFKEVKDKIATGTVSPSYTTRLLEAKGTLAGDSQFDEEELIKDTAGAMYGAGASTTVNAVTNFILALVLHPHVQKKAQAEIDTVTGGSRLPTFADHDSLPYLHMVIAESLRWNPVTPLGIPHAARRDDVYNNMFIPKGSIVMANIWALLHDEKMYPEPHKFWPERFDGRFPDAPHPRSYAFGFNRRICPGRHLALNSLFIQVANLLTIFNFSKARDAHGNVIEPIVDYSNSTPKPFKCTVTPRSDAAVSWVRSVAATTAS